MSNDPIFISYARDDDEPFVRRLHEDLVAAGFPVWWDRTAMESRGRNFLQEIRDAIQRCDRLIAVIGPSALRSDYVKYEWDHAALFAKTVTPLLRIGSYSDLSSAVIGELSIGSGEQLSQLHCPDFREPRPYLDAFDELVRLVSTPPAPLGVLHGVPGLPPHFLPRPDQIRGATDALLADISAPLVVAPTDHAATMHGMGGIGKSVTAAAIARSTKVRRTFSDVIWLPMSRGDEESSLLGSIRRVARALGDDTLRYEDLESTKDRLTKLLSDKRVLIVLDDLWDQHAATIFRDAAGPSVRLLLTTRDATLATTIGGQACEVDLLTDDQSCALLASWMGASFQTLSDAARQVAKVCGNLPLAVSIAGAILRENPGRVDYVLARFRTYRLDRLERQLPNYGYPSLLRALAISVEHMDEQTRKFFECLAVFVRSTPIPEGAFITFFSSLGHDAADTQQLIDRVCGLSLLRRVGSREYQLHDLVYAYLRGRSENASALNAQLIAAYQTSCPGHWSNGPDDGYFFQHLLTHLGSADQVDELVSLALSVPWLKRKMEVISAAKEQDGAAVVIADLRVILDRRDLASEARGQISAVHAAIRQSLQILRDTQLLGQQLLARLDESCKYALGAIRDAAYLDLTPGQLEPLCPSLHRTDGLEYSFRTPASNITSSVLVEDEDLIICGGFSGRNRVHTVDLRNGRIVAEHADYDAKNLDPYDGEEGQITLALSTDKSMLLSSGSFDADITFRDRRTGELRGKLSVPNWLNAIQPMGTSFAVSASDHHLQLWDLVTYQQVCEIEVTADNFPDSELRPRMKCVAPEPAAARTFAGDSAGNLIVFDLTDRRVKQRISDDSERHNPELPNAVSSILLDQKNKCLLVARGTQILILASHDLTLLNRLEPRAGVLDSLSLSECGRYLACASEKGIIVWDYPSRSIISVIPQSSFVCGLHMRNNGLVILTDLFGDIRAWDSAVAASGSSQVGHSYWVADVLLGAQGEIAVSVAQKDPNIIFWNPKNGAQIGAIRTQHGDRLTIAWLSDGSTLLSADEGNTIVAWSAESKEELWRLQSPSDGVSTLRVLSNSHEILLLSGHWDGEVLLWDLDSRTLVGRLPRREADSGWRWPNAGPVRSLDFTTDGRHIVVGTEDYVEVWNRITLERVRRYTGTFAYDRSDHYIHALSCLPDGRIVTASTDGMVMIRPADDYQGEETLNLDAEALFPMEAAALSTSRDGRYILVASRSNRAHLISTIGGHTQNQFWGDSGMTACGCDAEARYMAVGDMDGRVHFLRRK